MGHIKQEKLIEQFKTLGKSIKVTYGKYEVPAACTPSDLEWNQMDQDHRPWIHSTYLTSLRVAVTPDAQLSVTRLKRFFYIPFFVSVSDVRVSPGLFYQGFTIFNLLYVHVVTRCRPGLHTGEWYIVSHPIFTPLHWLLNKKLVEMNTEQNLEDIPLRDRRADLRARGYGFAHENPDFITANLKTNNVIFPKMIQVQSVKLAPLVQGQHNSVKIGPIELLIRPDGNGHYSVWNEVCPHEGGPMKKGKVCGDEIQCPWHGLKFSAAKLSPENPSADLGSLHFELESQSGELRVSSR